MNGELYCPGCGNDGAFDGQGTEEREFRRVSSQGRQEVVEQRSRHRCTECGDEFLIVEDTEVKFTGEA